MPLLFIQEELDGNQDITIIQWKKWYEISASCKFGVIYGYADASAAADEIVIYAKDLVKNKNIQVIDGNKLATQFNRDKESTGVLSVADKPGAGVALPIDVEAAKAAKVPAITATKTPDGK